MTMLFLLLACNPLPSADKVSQSPIAGIQLTWYGVTNLILQTADSNILLDAFYSRPTVQQGGATEQGAQLLADALEQNQISNLDAILIGHSHFDHALDAGIAALNHGGTVYGSQTTCLLSQSQGLATDRCIVVENEYVFSIGAIEVTVVRTIHSNPEQGFLGGQHDELTETPQPNEVLFAPHGGVYSYHLRFPNHPNEPSIFFQNTLGPIDADDLSGIDYNSTLQNHFQNTSLPDLWVTCGNCLEAAHELAEYIEIIRPKNLLALHFDGEFPDISIDPAPFVPADWYLSSLNTTQHHAPTDYGQKYCLIDGQFGSCPE